MGIQPCSVVSAAVDQTRSALVKFQVSKMDFSEACLVDAFEVCFRVEDLHTGDEVAAYMIIMLAMSIKRLITVYYSTGEVQLHHGERPGGVSGGGKLVV